MLKYVSKFILEIMPSIVATVVGAYIVNHYIVSRPGEAPAATVAAIDSKRAGATGDLKAGAKAAAGSVNVANIPEAGVRAKGISEKAIEKTPVEKVTETKDKAASSTAASAETKRPQTHDKAARPAPDEAAAIPIDRRDANDLARTVIERLRDPADPRSDPKVDPKTDPRTRQASAPHTREAPHAVVQEAIAVTPQPQIQVTPTPVSPLPPPIMVSTPEASASARDSRRDSRPGLTENRRMDLVPPADIPVASEPLDLEANATPAPRREHNVTTVADDMLSAAKSVFQAVLPK